MSSFNLHLDEGHLRAALSQDPDYAPHAQRLYVHRRTGELLTVYDSDDDAEAEDGLSEENRAKRERVKRHPRDYLEIPIPDHAQRHVWLQQFLEERGRLKEYVKSIGLWVKGKADDEDRSEWQEYQCDRTLKHVREFLESSGFLVVID